MLSAPSAAKLVLTRPAAWTASTCSNAPCWRQSAAASETGWSVPVSLFASIRQTSAGGPISMRASVGRSATPSSSTGRISAPGAAARTASCSVAPTITRRAADSPAMASMLASVPPEVNTTFSVRASNRAAMAIRASSNMRRAARPAAWTEAGLPTRSSAARTATRASGRNGSVALASR